MGQMMVYRLADSRQPHRQWCDRPSHCSSFRHQVIVAVAGGHLLDARKGVRPLGDEGLGGALISVALVGKVLEGEALCENTLVNLLALATLLLETLDEDSFEETAICYTLCWAVGLFDDGVAEGLSLVVP
ncbi:hypothetical protein HAX54_042181 [Datura stramonium]|uniref:Uncharacterized protein n=1 Tax=Datura stramonium TaxID=4076 RepID=A0ABS8W0P0_DATST|nr:hypothetical protein [Datura stramonium]